MTPLTDDEVRWLVNSHTCSQEMVGDTCRVCWLANERAALLAERDALSVEVADLRAQVAEGRANLVKQFTAALAVDMELRAELAAVVALNAALAVENDEADTLNTRLGDILTLVANALKGEPDSRSLHSWADLAQVAAALKEKAERLHAAYRGDNITLEDRDTRLYCGDCAGHLPGCGGWPVGAPEVHAPECPAHPDFLTTSAAESREAKGGDA